MRRVTPVEGINKHSSDTLRDRLNALSAQEKEALKRKLAGKRMSGAALVAEGLLRCGVKRVIGITGTPVDQVFAECAATGIRLIGARHQQAAVLTAASANYVAGRLESVVIVSAGPGVTNTLTGVLVARDNGWPVIVMGGRSPLHRAGIGYFQELNAVPIFAPVTKWAAGIQSSSEIMGVVIKAFEIAAAGRPGPVYIDLPQDILDGSAAVDDSLMPVLEAPPDAAFESIAEAARMIRSGTRPLMILGEEIRWSFNPNDLERMAGELGIPFITSPLGRGFLPDDHPLCANDARRWIQSKADVVVMVGAWFDWRFRFGAELAPDARVVHVDINPQTLGKNIEPALKICANSGRFLSQLAEVLTHSFQGEPVPSLRAWHAIIQAACRTNRRNRTERLSNDAGFFSFYQLYQSVLDFMPAKSVVVLDGGIALAMGQAMLSAKSPCSWLDPGWNGCMGTGIPFGMGAKLAAPDHQVIVICGDYSFGLNAIDLETAVRHAIPIVVVIANNNGINGAARQKRCLPADYPERFSEFQPALKYEQLLKAFGGYAEWIDEAGALYPALERAAASGLPACINVRVDPDTPHPGTW